MWRSHHEMGGKKGGGDSPGGWSLAKQQLGEMKPGFIFFLD